MTDDGKRWVSFGSIFCKGPNSKDSAKNRSTPDRLQRRRTTTDTTGFHNENPDQMRNLPTPR